MVVCEDDDEDRDRDRARDRDGYRDRSRRGTVNQSQHRSEAHIDADMGTKADGLFVDTPLTSTTKRSSLKRKAKHCASSFSAITNANAKRMKMSDDDAKNQDDVPDSGDSYADSNGLLHFTRNANAILIGYTFILYL